MKSGYACDNCNEFTQSRAWIFNCIECEKEICESCMYSWATCKECAAGKTDEFLSARFNAEFVDESPIGLTSFLVRAFGDHVDLENKSDI